MVKIDGVNPFKAAFSGGVAVVKKLKLGTAVDTDIALSVIIIPAVVLVMIFTPYWWFAVFLLIPLFSYLLHYQYHMKNNPQMLRTEKHVETLRRIEVGAMGNSKKIIEGHEISDDSATAGNPVKIENGGRK